MRLGENGPGGEETILKAVEGCRSLQSRPLRARIGPYDLIELWRKKDRPAGVDVPADREGGVRRPAVPFWFLAVKG